MKQLSHRLNQLFELISQDCHTFYDLCCDHGDIALKVALEKDIPKVVACDRVQSICNKLEEKLTAYITDPCEVSVICTDAKDLKYCKDKSNLFLIAGVGTNTTISILESLKAPGQSFILSTHKNPWELREYLHKNNFQFLEERLVKDNDKFYQMIKVKYVLTKDQSVSRFGQQIWANDEISQEYRLSLLQHLEAIPAHKYQELKDFLKNFNNDTIS